MNEEISEEVLEYLHKRFEEQENKVTKALMTLQQNDAWELIQEAAIMGFVQGHMCGSMEFDIPADRQILKSVVGGCMDFPDAYPEISGLTNE